LGPWVCCRSSTRRRRCRSILPAARDRPSRPRPGLTAPRPCSVETLAVALRWRSRTCGLTNSPAVVVVQLPLTEPDAPSRAAMLPSRPFVRDDDASRVREAILDQSERSAWTLGIRPAWRTYNQSFMDYLIAHEFGHALGLSDSPMTCPLSNSVMDTPFSTCGQPMASSGPRTSDGMAVAKTSCNPTGVTAVCR
jgi:hypothetical protein